MGRLARDRERRGPPLPGPRARRDGQQLVAPLERHQQESASPLRRHASRRPDPEAGELLPQWRRRRWRGLSMLSASRFYLCSLNASGAVQTASAASVRSKSYSVLPTSLYPLLGNSVPVLSNCVYWRAESEWWCALVLKLSCVDAISTRCAVHYTAL